MSYARTGWTRARQRQQWAATAAAALAVGCDGGGGSGSGLLWGRRHRWVNARGTRTCGRAQVTKLGVRWRAGHGNGVARALAVKWLTVGKAQAQMLGRGGRR